MKTVIANLLLCAGTLLGDVPKQAKPVVLTNYLNLGEKTNLLGNTLRSGKKVVNIFKVSEDSILFDDSAKEMAIYGSATNLLAFDYKAGTNVVRLLIANPSISVTNNEVLCGTFYILYPREWDVVSFYYDFPHEGKTSGRKTSILYECGIYQCTWELPLEKPLVGAIPYNSLNTEKRLRELTTLPLDKIRFEPGECRPEWIVNFDSLDP